MDVNGNMEKAGEMFTSSNSSFVKRRRMPAAALGLFASGLAVIAPQSAKAQDSAPAKQVCLDFNRIDHTEILNNHQILFYMLGRKIWINNLTSPCVTLKSSDGFVWESQIGRYCDNLETIRVIWSGEVCQLGSFTPYDKPPAS